MEMKSKGNLCGSSINYTQWRRTNGNEEIRTQSAVKGLSSRNEMQFCSKLNPSQNIGNTAAPESAE